MPQTVLRGPNGGPAIDQATGMPLTMEEMLRRNGIVGMGNTVSMMGPQSDPNQQRDEAVPVVAANTVGGPPSGPTGSGTAVGAAMGQRSGGRGTVPSGPPAPAGGPSGAAADPAMAQLEATGIDPETAEMLEGAGLLAAGTAAAYAIYKMRGPAGVGATVPGAATGTDLVAPTAKNIPEAEYTVVDEPKRVGDGTRRALSSRSAASRIEGPQKRLPGTTRKGGAMEKAMQARTGSTASGTVPGQAPRKFPENNPVDSFKISPESESALGRVIKLLQNPQVARTLSRVP